MTASSAIQGAPLPALKSLDQHDRVIYSGTFSKVMFPGLRPAYVVAPGQCDAAVPRGMRQHECRGALSTAGKRD